MVEVDQSKRQEKRDSLFLNAAIRLADGAVFETRVRNLSPGGMMIDVTGELAVGTALVAEMRGVGQVGGRIAWFSPGRAGVAFNHEIDPRLTRSMGPSTKSVMPDYLKTYGAKPRPGLSVR